MSVTADAAAVVARLGGETFLSQAFGRYFHRVEGDRKLVADIINWDDINEIISRHRLETPRMRVMAQGQMVPLEAYSAPMATRHGQMWRRIHPAALHGQLADGASLVIDSVDELHPGAHQLAGAMEKLFRTKVQVNLYASWTRTESFGTHWDDHDVVIVQIDGSKRWKLFGTTRTAPISRDLEEPELPPKTPVAEVVLTPGDMLYLPRGWWHSAAASEGEPSLHLTCGLHPLTGADLLTWLADALRRHDVVRQDVPRFGTTKEKKWFVDALRDLVNDELTYPSVIDEFARHGDDTEEARLRPSLPYVRSPVPTDPGISVWMVTTRHALRDNFDGTVTLTAGGESWTVADAACPLLERLVDGGVHRIGELIDGTELTVAEAAALIGNLVHGQVAALGGHR